MEGVNSGQFRQLLELKKKHQITFQKECEIHSEKILACLHNLKNHPKNVREIQTILESADIIIGAAKFLENKKLEEQAKFIVSSFLGIDDIRKKINECDHILNYFENLKKLDF